MASLFTTIASRVPKRKSAADMLYDEIGRETPQAAQSYLDESTRAAVSAGLPEFNRELQDVRENAIRRGVSNGLGTFYEGDLASAFERNIANATSSKSLDVYESSRNRLLDLLSGQRDYEMAVANAKKKKKAGLFGALGTLAGGVGGFLLGGPKGAELGASIGGTVGSGIGG